MFPAPVIVTVEGIHVVRDDHIPGGTKRRVLEPLVAKSAGTEFVYASPAYGYAQIALAYSDHDVAELLAREDVQILLRDEYVDFFRALRVEDIDGYQSAVGIKNVSLNERYLAHRAGEQPVLPPTILTEAVAQVGAILILAKPENRE